MRTSADVFSISVDRNSMPLSVSVVRICSSADESIGTPSIIDHEDSFTITTALSGYYFQKTVENLSSHVSPAVVAAPGDRLRYRLRLFNVDQTINGITISGPLDLNSFVPGTFAMVTLPAGATYSFDQATGQLEIRGDGGPLNVAVGDEIVVEFDLTLESTLTNGTEVLNQASFVADDALSALSDDPFVNGNQPTRTRRRARHSLS
jgi:hypothetical protein